MSTCHGSNQFPDVTIVVWKIGKEFTWQKRMYFFVQGWGNTSKCCDSFARQKANTDVTFSVCRISFHRGICQLSWFTRSVCACRVRFMVLTVMSQKSVVFYEQHMSRFQLCQSFSDSALGNEMHLVLPLILFEMMNTSGALNYNKSNGFMQQCGWGGGLVTAAKSAALPPIN